MREQKPRKRVPELDEEVKVIAETLCEMSGTTIPNDVNLYAVNQSAGYWTPSKRYITIPTWVFKTSEGKAGFRKKQGYDIYYIAHELAHMVVTELQRKHRKELGYLPVYSSHGPEFMREFKKICPEEYWHYELGYKPRNARMAGITMPR